MNKQMLLLTALLMSLSFGAWIVEAFGQTSTTPSVGDKIKVSQPKAQTPVSVEGIPAQFNLETRVQLLERQVAELRSQVNYLTTRIDDRGASPILPSGRLTLPETDGDESSSGYSGPQIKVPKGKDEK